MTFKNYVSIQDLASFSITSEIQGFLLNLKQIALGFDKLRNAYLSEKNEFLDYLRLDIRDKLRT